MPIFLLTTITLLGAIITISTRKTKETKEILRIFLLWILGVNVGIAGLIGFVGHAFMADQVALYIGWMPGSPFQFEIAISNLMVGILGLMCLWFGQDVWLVTIVTTTIFAWGCAYGHIKDMIVNHNYALGNAGIPLYTSIVAPAIIIILFATYKSIKIKRVEAPVVTKRTRTPKVTKTKKAKVTRTKKKQK